MAVVAVILETPALVPVGLPIVVSDYDVQREINAAGAFSALFPASRALANQVRSRWRVSMIEEGRPGFLMRRGVVTNRSFRAAEDGTGMLTLSGYSRLYAMAAGSTHLGLAYVGSQTIEDIANDLSGETVRVPASAPSRRPKVTFNDTTDLAAFLSAAEYARYNVRETFESGDEHDPGGLELVEQDNVPDSGFRFVNVEHAGPELENAAADGMGLIAGTPTIGYAGGDLATRIIPVGAEWDGKPLTLEHSDKTSPYDIRTGTNPDGSTYWYLQDDAAVELYGVIEMPLVRTDVKNPSDDASTRRAAANALYALTAGELIKRRYDVISFASEIANGRHIDALPGDRVHIQFRGRALTPARVLTWHDIDQDFLIAKRREASIAAGVRGVSFTLTAPEVPMTIPALPEAVPIPPPPSDPPDPPRPEEKPEDPQQDAPPFEDPGLPQNPGLPKLSDPRDGIGHYQSCCAYPPIDLIADPTPPPDMDCAGNFLFEWDAGVDGEGEPTYVLDVSVNADFSGQTQYPTSGHSQLVSGLVPGTIYYARIESHFADTSVQTSAPITVEF